MWPFSGTIRSRSKQKVPAAPARTEKPVSSDHRDEDFDEPDDGRIRIEAPYFVVNSCEQCWKCGELSPVIGLAATSVFDPSDSEEPIGNAILNGILDMPKALLAQMKQRNKRYKMGSSRAAGGRYYMNHCHSCGAVFGDFFMYREPGGAFWPTSFDEAELLKLEELALTEPIILTASFGCHEAISRCLEKALNPADERS